MNPRGISWISVADATLLSCLCAWRLADRLPIDILNLPPLCGGHIRQLSRIYRAKKSSDERESEFVRAMEASDSCPACLHIRWKAGFERASRSVRTDSVGVYLRDMAELKRTFPGCPREATPRHDCRSVEEYLLKKGHSFRSAALTPEELGSVRDVFEELKRLRDEEWRSANRGDVHIRISPLLGMGRAFDTAQLAWRAGKGVIGYAEGFARHGEGSTLRFNGDPEGAGPLYHPWNLINGKVVDFCSRRRPRDDDAPRKKLRDISLEDCVVGIIDPETEYFGTVLTQKLKKQSTLIRNRRWGRRILFLDDDRIRGHLGMKRGRSRSVR